MCCAEQISCTSMCFGVSREKITALFRGRSHFDRCLRDISSDTSFPFILPQISCVHVCVRAPLLFQLFIYIFWVDRCIFSQQHQTLITNQIVRNVKIQSAKVTNGCLLIGGKEKEGGSGFVCFSFAEPKEVLTALRWADR